ncbi:MAG TPA: response regulator [Abditibacteriaceae bacterium]|jgi:CheY-like chemotaxis protein
MNTILVADDDSDILHLVSATLRGSGYDILQTHDGEEALETALREHPTLAVLDVNMPRRDGFQVTSALRNNPTTAQMPIIILSARGAESDRITGFEEGADDYLVKPFSPRELQLRVGVLMARAIGAHGTASSKNAATHSRARNGASSSTHSANDVTTVMPTAPDTCFGLPEGTLPLPQISTGHATLDAALGGGLPVGSNILLHGPIGSGKSTLCRQFMATGLLNKERTMFIAVDDAPQLIRQMLDRATRDSTDSFEERNLFRLVDGYSWGAGGAQSGERYAVTGILELNQLSGVVQDAGVDLGQTVRNRLGGRRVLDSISSLLINFELPSVQRFLAQVARNAVAFGGVSTFFVLEEGTVDDRTLANIKYLMDGVVETRVEDGRHLLRVASMKWTQHSRDWLQM